MKIIKRNGAEVPFDITKIITAVTKASDSVSGQSRLTKDQITQIAAAVTDQCQALNRAVSVEEVQDMVENQLMDIKAHDVARHYITYRYVQSLKRQTNTTDERILSKTSEQKCWLKCPLLFRQLNFKTNLPPL